MVKIKENYHYQVPNNGPTLAVEVLKINANNDVEILIKSIVSRTGKRPTITKEIENWISDRKSITVNPSSLINIEKVESRFWHHFSKNRIKLLFGMH